ncbi:MAG TPA: hypothetical protein IGS52_11285 [Oscillatoriaceae cyanobacterium M33_DOE_052]|nr:hypothetical protein [Oscillatoriaceae cyanobacterium M33_DOE_052]
MPIFFTDKLNIYFAHQICKLNEYPCGYADNFKFLQSYCSIGFGDAMVKIGTHTLRQIPKKSMMNKNRQEILKETAAIHRETLQKHLQHRLEVARAKGDENLVRLLEIEANSLK